MAKRSIPPTIDHWSSTTELVTVSLTLQPLKDVSLQPQYMASLYAWFLKQVQQDDPSLATLLQEDSSVKPFTLSGLDNIFPGQDEVLQLEAQQTYEWRITALSAASAQWLNHWLANLPDRILLHRATLQILAWTIVQPPTQYQTLLDQEIPDDRCLGLSFFSPTSFRYQGNYLPLPIPRSLLQGYLQCWNAFSGQSVSVAAFLQWAESAVVINRCWLDTQNVAAGKLGLVTGFLGSLELSLLQTKAASADFAKLLFSLGHLAAYCGTGDETIFGLGHTVLGWMESLAGEEEPASGENAVLAERIEALKTIFLNQRKRPSGERAMKIARTWATILARREQDDTLQQIADDLGMQYETVKTYAKLARRALRTLSETD